jgi:twitching motility protein PilJ
MSSLREETKGLSGTTITPRIAGLGLLFLLGVFTLLLLNSANDAGTRSGATAAAGTQLTALLAAQSAILSARHVVADSSPEAVSALSDAARRLEAAEKSGLSPQDANAIDRLLTNIEAVQNGRNTRQALAGAGRELDGLLPELEDLSSVLEQAIVVQSPAVVAAHLDRLRLLGESMRRNVQGLASGTGDSVALTQQLLDADMALTQVVRGFEAGDPALGLRAVKDADAINALAALAETTRKIGNSVKNVLALSDQMAAVDSALLQLDALAAELLPDQSLVGGIATGGLQGFARVLTMVLLLGTMLILGAIIWNYYRSTDVRKNVELQAKQTERNQAAIVRLLDELDSLADGDLTVMATVTEDITGAIADSINFAIEKLRELVITLNDSAIMVDGAAKQTDLTAQQLSEASETQSNQIEAASEAILSMVASIEEISGNAERSSDVARHSVDVAHKGGDAVRRTIEGMNTIRETIQDTAKRIKRLGESSQEIGNIIELINDIADQTNILALNASIQASMAGEAGRGFAVVADEVQRLAERSANATKKIEVLVRTIQTDTKEAVVSMERSTTDVVGGALLAENAGAALEEIEQVSNQIASLVQNISGSARTQATAAATVTRNVDVLQEINMQTRVGTSATTESIRKLAELAAQLRKSVAGFRLPTAIADYEDDENENEYGDNDEYEGVIHQSISLDDDEVSFVDQKTA